MKLTFLAFLAAGLLQDPSPSDQARALMEDGQQAEAFQIISDAAKEGDPEAVDYLGWYYDTGTYVERDRATAARYFERAAEAGVPHAQWRLGVMMDSGECACGSTEEAFELFKLAAAQGWTNAMVSLGVMHATGRGTPQNFTAARESYAEGARAGNTQGLSGIGTLYMNGEGTTRDPQEAAAWFLVATVNGNEHTSSLLETRFRDFDLDMTKAVSRANVIAEEYGYPANLRLEE